MMQILIRWLKRALLLLWALVVLILSAKITLDNPEQTTLRLLGAEFSASNGVLFMISLSSGILLGVCSILPTLYWAKLRCQRSEQREAVTKKQLANSDNLPSI